MDPFGGGMVHGASYWIPSGYLRHAIINNPFGLSMFSPSGTVLMDS